MLLLPQIQKKKQKNLFWEVSGINQAAFVADFSTIVSGVWAPGHSYTEMDFVDTLYGKSLGSNQAAFVTDFSMKVSGV